MKKRGKFRKALDQPWAAMTFAACAGVVLFVLLSHLGLIGKGLVKLYGFVEPVFIGLVIAYVTDPLVVFYEEHVFRKVGRKNIRRGLSVAATYLSIVVFIALILVSLIPQLISSVRLFISNLDSYSSAFNVLMKDLTDWAASHNVDISKYTSVGSDIGGLITSSLPQSVDGILNKTITYGKNVFDAVIAIIIAIYFLMDKTRLLRGGHRLWRAIVSEGSYRRSSNFLVRCNEIMIRFIVFDLLDGLITGCANAAFMLVAGYPYLPLISIVVGVTNLAPTFGPIVGAVIGAGILLLVNPWYALVFLIFTIALQTVDGYVIKPKLFGNTLGVPSIGILIAIIVFGRMFGAVGVLLSIPVAAILDYIYKDGILPKLESRKERKKAAAAADAQAPQDPECRE